MGQARFFDLDVYRRGERALTHSHSSSRRKANQASLQHVDLAASVHFTLHELEFLDRPLHLSFRPWRRYGGLSRSSVLADAAVEPGNEACASTREPCSEPVCGHRSDH